MPIVQSVAGQDLLTAYKAKQQAFGNTFVQSFAAKCLRRLNDKPDDCPATLMNFIKDTSGRFVHGRSDESLDETKDRYYQQWTQRILNGEFDEEAPKIKEPQPTAKKKAKPEPEPEAPARFDPTDFAPTPEPEPKPVDNKQMDKEIIPTPSDPMAMVLQGIQAMQANSGNTDTDDRLTKLESQITEIQDKLNAIAKCLT